MTEKPGSTLQSRIASLKNILPLLRMVWDASPATVLMSIVLRAAAALVPVAVLIVARAIMDEVVGHAAVHREMSRRLWELVALEFALAAAGALLGRATMYFN